MGNRQLETPDIEPIRYTTRGKMITVWLVVIAVLVLLYSVRDMAGPFFWAMVVAYIFHPLIKWSHEKTKVPRFVWIILLYVAAFALIGWAVAVLIPLIERQYEDLIKGLPEVVNSIRTFVSENSRLEFYGFSLDLQAISDEFIAALGNLVRNLPGQALEGITVVFGTVFKIVIFLVATVHFLLFGERWVGTLISLIPPRLQAELVPVLSRIHRTMGAYLRTQLIRIAMVSTIVYVALTILQVRFALILAIMAGFLDIVPTLGPTVSSAVTALVALFQPTTPFGWSHVTLAIATVILYIGLNQLEENIILPPLIGAMVDLPPLVVLFAVLAGGQMVGILGLLLAVPFAASFKIVLRYLYAKVMDMPVQLDEAVVRRYQPIWRRKRKEPRR